MSRFCDCPEPCGDCMSRNYCELCGKAIYDEAKYTKEGFERRMKCKKSFWRG